MDTTTERASVTKNTSRFILIGVIVAAVAAFVALDLGQYLSFEALKTQRDALQGQVAAHPVLSITLFFVAYVLVAALALPGAAIMTLAGGALFGLVTGTLVVSFASSIGATLAFLGARFLFRDSIQARFGDKLKTLNDGIDREGGFYLLALRLVPVFPFFVINVLGGLTSLRPRTFYWVSQLGMLPATAVYVNAGTELAQVDSAGDILSPQLIGAFVLLGVLPLIARTALNAYRKRT